MSRHHALGCLIAGWISLGLLGAGMANFGKRSSWPLVAAGKMQARRIRDWSLRWGLLCGPAAPIVVLGFGQFIGVSFDAEPPFPAAGPGPAPIDGLPAAGRKGLAP